MVLFPGASWRFFYKSNVRFYTGRIPGSTGDRALRGPLQSLARPKPQRAVWAWEFCGAKLREYGRRDSVSVTKFRGVAGVSPAEGVAEDPRSGAAARGRLPPPHKSKIAAHYGNGVYAAASLKKLGNSKRRCIKIVHCSFTVHSVLLASSFYGKSKRY